MYKKVNQLYEYILLFVVQLLSHVQLFVTQWTTARQSSTSFTISLSLPKFMFIESVIISSHLILCCFLLFLPSIFPSMRVISNELALLKGGQSIGDSALIFPMNIQDWFPLGLTGLIPLLSKELSRGFSNTTIQKHQFLDAQPSWRRKWQPTPVFLPGVSHGWRSLVGYSLWGHKNLDTTEWLTHTTQTTK